MQSPFILSRALPPRNTAALYPLLYKLAAFSRPGDMKLERAALRPRLTLARARTRGDGNGRPASRLLALSTTIRRKNFKFPSDGQSCTSAEFQYLSSVMERYRAHYAPLPVRGAPSNRPATAAVALLDGCVFLAKRELAHLADAKGCSPFHFKSTTRASRTLPSFGGRGIARARARALPVRLRLRISCSSKSPEIILRGAAVLTPSPFRLAASARAFAHSRNLLHCQRGAV